MKNLQVGFGTWAIAGWTVLVGAGFAFEGTTVEWPFPPYWSALAGFASLMWGGLVVNGARARRSELTVVRKGVGAFGEILGAFGLFGGIQALFLLEDNQWLIASMLATVVVSWAWAAFGKKETVGNRASYMVTGGVVLAAIAVMLLCVFGSGHSFLTTVRTQQAAIWDKDGVGYRARVTTSNNFKYDSVAVSVGRRFLIWTYGSEDIMRCSSGYGTVGIPEVRFEAPSTIVVTGGCTELAQGKMAPQGSRYYGSGKPAYDGMGIVFEK